MRVRVGVGVLGTLVFAPEDSECLFHEEKGRKTNEDPEAIKFEDIDSILLKYKGIIYPMRIFLFS